MEVEQTRCYRKVGCDSAWWWVHLDVGGAVAAGVVAAAVGTAVPAAAAAGAVRFAGAAAATDEAHSRVC